MKTRLLLGLVLLATAGCSSGLSQIATVQEEKEQLIAAIRQQKEELDELRKRNDKLSAQLNEAEIEIARGPSFSERHLASRALEAKSSLANDTKPAQEIGSGTIASTKPATEQPKPNTIASQPTVEPPPVSEVKSQLDWKPNRGEAGPAAGVVDSSELQAWAAQKDWLKYDPVTQSVTVDLDLKFEQNGTTLENEAKNQLDELADLLKKPAGKSLKVMVAGRSQRGGVASVEDGSGERYTTPRHLGSARALAVADYLDRHGIASDRLGITAVAAESASDAAGSEASRLSIHVLPGDRPMVGWAPPADTIRR